MIQNIEVKYLHRHPDNPRKDLGDLTELAESIKANGILQNLTVVKTIGNITKTWVEGVYTVVIGHRRLAAAKLAGLTEVPCAVVEMDHRQQVATMLLENMQRSDLTIYEQAQGFQMMLDLGETVNEISEQTGFSETTVRRRVKLLELDQEKFRESANRNVTLMEYAELEKIDNIELRNKVLDSIGTSNFKYELQKAVDSEKKEKWLAKAFEELDKFALKMPEQPRDSQYVYAYYASQNEDVEVPEDAGERKYFYTVSDYGYITLYGEASEVDENTAETEKREKERARYSALNQIVDRTYGLRRDFILNISNSKAKKNVGLVIENIIRSIMDSYGNLNYKGFANMHGATTPDDGEENIDNLIDDIRKCPEKSLLITTFLYMDGSSQGYHTWNCQYRENEELDRVYDMLESLGYEISDEEQQLRDGTHPLFDVESEQDSPGGR